MQERLSKVVGRTENVVTPVEGDDIFPILHRRLFTTVGSEKIGASWPMLTPTGTNRSETPSLPLPGGQLPRTYRDRLSVSSRARRHPDQPLGSLSGFQRTRGALRALAHTVKALSQRQHMAPLIHAGDVALLTRVFAVRSSGLLVRATRRRSTPTSFGPTRRPPRRTGGGAARWKSSGWRQASLLRLS